MSKLVAPQFSTGSYTQKVTQQLDSRLKSDFSRCVICKVPLSSKDKVEWCCESYCPRTIVRTDPEKEKTEGRSNLLLRYILRK